MARPNAHAAICTPSSSERWLHCTAAPRFEENFPSVTTVYAEEGTLAHSACELYGRKYVGDITQRKFSTQLNKLKKNDLWNDEMVKCAEFYIGYIAEKANSFVSMPHIAFEVRVDLSDYIPECFGTCDCIMIGDGALRIVDYKHGKGVAVSSINNSQMRLYALGALKRYEMVYGDSIREVYTAIVQPRITEDVTEEHLTVEELKEWGETVVKPKAQLAYAGLGTYEPGEWCRFCRGACQCRARAEYYAGFEQFKEKEIQGKLTPEEIEKTPADNMLSDDEIAELLDKAKELCKWYSDLQDYTLQAILSGKEITGWKVVEGRSNRAFTDADEAMKRMIDKGYDEALLYDRKPKTLAQMEKITGKKDFSEIMEGLIFNPPGKPTLVKSDDKRKDYTPKRPDASEFAGA